MEGFIRSGTVVNIQPFGTFVQVDGVSLLVHAFDQSWYWPYDPSRHKVVGEEVALWYGRVSRYGQDSTIASFRLVYPEHNPLPEIQIGTLIVGTVAFADDQRVGVTFGPASDVDFRAQVVKHAGIALEQCSAGRSFACLVDLIDEGPKIILTPKNLIT